MDRPRSRGREVRGNGEEPGRDGETERGEVLIRKRKMEMGRGSEWLKEQKAVLLFVRAHTHIKHTHTHCASQ